MVAIGDEVTIHVTGRVVHLAEKGAAIELPDGTVWAFSRDRLDAFQPGRADD